MYRYVFLSVLLCCSFFSCKKSETPSSVCNAPANLIVSNITETSAVFSWDANDGASGYEYVLNVTATPGPAGTLITSNTYSAADLVSGTTYYFHVRAKCTGNQFSSWTTITFNTDTSVCISPANLITSNITDTSATFNWSSVANSEGFEYSLDLSEDNPSGPGTFITENTLQIATLIPNTNYYLHIRTKCGTNKFSAWTTTSFKTKDDYVTWLIKQGKNFAEGNSYPPFSGSYLRFKAIFDSSCIYTTTDPNNQADICKLYGFADNNSFHQVNSARFGWNWLNDSLRIHAYCYVDSVRIFKELGTVPLNTPSEYTLEVVPGKYIFTLNGKKDTMDRLSMDPVANGYRLFPYFGGDEPAPHDIRIKIKDIL